ncbi:TIGR02594 family protein [Hyphomicrobium sp. ghe19]|uniref:TIGR02594 family protein n=1 Tax=Hyphomicrobium sp. ghe19 TaxID=2682968 RepID=UPI001366C1FB|nr:hypothetical protein HYPP_02405 [Hyphomicrobium sp. ghe19]
MASGTPAQYAAAPWMRIAESYRGVKRVKGGNNDVILKFFKESGHPQKDANLAWCAAFANAVLFEAGLRGTQNLMARSFLNWDGGRKVTQPQFGDLAIFSRGKPGSGLGHVTYFVEWDEDTVTCLGGNQGAVGEVNVQKFSRARLIGFRRPIQKIDAKTVIPAMTDMEKPDKKPEAATGFGTILAAITAFVGHYETAIIVAGVATLTVFAFWYWKTEKARIAAAEMTPQYKPLSRVAAAKKIAEFVPPPIESEATPPKKPRVARKTSRMKQHGS